MNNKLEEQLSKVVEKSIGLAEKTGEFVIEQAPQLLQEFYNWHITESIIYLLLGLFILVLPILFTVKNWKSLYDSDFGAGCVITCFFTTLSGICISIYNLIELIKILVAPKLYLIEYFIE